MIIVLISRYTDIIGTYYLYKNKNSTDNTKVNQKNLIYNTVNRLLYYILYKNNNIPEIMDKLINLIHSLIHVRIKIIDNAYNDRIRKRPRIGYVYNKYDHG